MSSPRVKASYHNVSLIIIVTFVVASCYPALIDTAVVRSEVRFDRDHALVENKRHVTKGKGLNKKLSN